MEVAAEDRIGLLPDCLLGNIVSLLPIKDAARTMQLSRRWQSIWPSLPLDLDLDARDADIPSDARSISGILSSHCAGANIRRFYATTRADQATAVGWLRTLAQRHLDGSLALSSAADGARHLLSLDQLAAWDLRQLSLSRFRLVDPHPRAPLALNHLHILTLFDVKVSERSLHRMIAGCPNLRQLNLLRVHGLRRLVPHSRTLAVVHLASLRVPLDEISFRHTPNAEIIVLGYVNLWRLYPNIIDEAVLPSKLSTVHLALPLLDPPRFKAMPKSSLPIVTILVLSIRFSDGEELNRVAGMLSLFPSLQQLRIWCLNFDSKDKLDAFGSWLPPAAASTIVCLRKHLKHVRLLGYCGTTGEQQFARFLMAGAKSLMDMQIIHAKIWSRQYIKDMRKFICSHGKGSLKAQINFMENNNIDNSRRNLDSSMSQVALI